MKKIKFVLFLCAFLMLFIIMPNNIFALSPDVSAQDTVQSNADLFDDIADMFAPKPKYEDLGTVILGGIPIGLSLDNDGIEVIGFSEIITENGAKCPASESGLTIGDKIIKINGEKVSKVSDLSKFANSEIGELRVTYLRNGQEYETFITPQCDVLSGNYKFGLWAKDVSNGVGTLTFVKDGKYFASLGHPITAKNGEIVEITGGSVYECTILGINKGIKGDAGELKGAFLNTKEIGKIYKNNKFGVYGQLSSYPEVFDSNKTIEVANIAEVKPGKAQIYSTISGETPKYYDIEIVKVTNQTQKDDKGLVIKVTDAELLEKAGGIVQGMSGSPIIQNGKIVGAVTHVFINDPTRGFGMFAQWMLTE